MYYLNLCCIFLYIEDNNCQKRERYEIKEKIQIIEKVTKNRNFKKITILKIKSDNFKIKN